ATHPTAGASSTHSIRFARHDRPCHPSVQFAPYLPKICAKKQDFRLYYSARRALIAYVRRRAEVLSAKTAHCEQDCLCKCSKAAPPGTWLFSRTTRKLPHSSLICVHLRYLRLRSFCSAFWLWLRRTESLWLTPLVIRVG